MIKVFSENIDLDLENDNAGKLISFVKSHREKITDGVFENMGYLNNQHPPFAKAHITCAIEYMMKEISRGDFPGDFLIEEEYGPEELIISNPS